MNKRTVIKTSIIILVIAIIIAAFFVIQSMILSGIYFEDQKNEQAMYNSMSFSDKLVYNKIRYDRNFGFAIGRIYEKNVEKRKKVIINEKETELFYCFSYDNKAVTCDYNPENINISPKTHIYIDNEKNVFEFDSTGRFIYYRLYNFYNYKLNKDINKISQDDANKIIISYFENIIPDLKEMECSEVTNFPNEGYSFVYEKQISDLFTLTCSLSITGDGKMAFVHSGVGDKDEYIAPQEETGVLERLDQYIKTKYASQIVKYDITDQNCYLINDEYCALFTVTFPTTGDIEQQQETILLKIK